MTLRLALRSLLAHPVRTAVLAGGFGLGVAVMAILLGVGQVVLRQAQSPARLGGGHVVISGVTGEVTNARFILSGALRTGPLADQVLLAAPSTQTTLHLTSGEHTIPVRVRGGIPSLERALDDPETAGIAVWQDSEADRAWAEPDAADVLRTMDRFRPVPDAPRWADSWAEWLYFNGRSGETRFYLTFLVGPETAPGRRAAGVRLQLDHGGRMRTFGESAEIDEATLLASAPDMAIGASRITLDGLEYRIRLDLPELDLPELPAPRAPGAPAPSRVSADIRLEAVPGRSLAPITIHGAQGWLSGYTVPVLAGPLAGRVALAEETISLEGGTGYHDHNWGFWEGVSWQWGQVHHGDLSFVYGRVFPPPEAADPVRMPGFLAALGPDGPLGYTTSVSIDEESDARTTHPRRIVVRGRGAALDLVMELTVEEAIVNRTEADRLGGGRDFLQLRGRYEVTGQVDGRRFEFSAPGAAETFRSR